MMTEDGRSPSGRATRPTDQAPTGLGDAASVPNADNLPHVIGEGVVKLGDLEIKVLQLSNGERVIEADSFHEIIGAIFGDDDAQESVR